jgi:hypothetical protein
LFVHTWPLIQPYKIVRRGPPTIYTHIFGPSNMDHPPFINMLSVHISSNVRLFTHPTLDI